MNNIRTTKHDFSDLGFHVIDIYDKYNEDEDMYDDTTSGLFLEITKNINMMVKSKKMCRGENLYVNSAEDLDYLIVIKSKDTHLPDQIYAFCALIKDNKLLSKLYKNGPRDVYKYLYADAICSHANVKYAGEKLIHVLFALAKSLNLNIELTSLERARSFYEKYGFVINTFTPNVPPLSSHIYFIDERFLYLETIIWNNNKDDISELATFYFNSNYFKQLANASLTINDAVNAIELFAKNYNVLIIKQKNHIKGFATIYVVDKTLYVLNAVTDDELMSGNILFSEIEKYYASMNFEQIVIGMIQGFEPPYFKNRTNENSLKSFFLEMGFIEDSQDSVQPFSFYLTPTYKLHTYLIMLKHIVKHVGGNKKKSKKLKKKNIIKNTKKRQNNTRKITHNKFGS